MSNHLSEDQISNWIIGRSTPEETQHGHECPQCRAELERFRESVLTFRVAMEDWSRQEPVPTRLNKSRGPALRWGLVTMTVVALFAVAIYQRKVEPRSGQETDQTASASDAGVQADAVLMDAVTTHISRPLPAPMERVFALLPGDAPETEPVPGEVR